MSFLGGYAMHLRILEYLHGFLVDEEAATAVEYAIMIVLITTVIIGTVAFLGGETEQAFNNFVVEFESAKS
jgi:Flp pilus assembly pilin Flp